MSVTTDTDTTGFIALYTSAFIAFYTTGCDAFTSSAMRLVLRVI